MDFFYQYVDYLSESGLVPSKTVTWNLTSQGEQGINI
jgi:hypothetical protein